MALNETLARITNYSVAFLITQDGGAGTTMTLSNNDFVGNLQGVGAGGALLELLTTDFNPNSQAIQRARLLGDASGIGGLGVDLRNVPHCEVLVMPRDGGAGWAVDADVDGVDADRGELNIIGPAAASTALITLQFRHTYDR
jgi:hypothetical protein